MDTRPPWLCWLGGYFATVAIAGWMLCYLCVGTLYRSLGEVRYLDYFAGGQTMVAPAPLLLWRARSPLVALVEGGVVVTFGTFVFELLLFIFVRWSVFNCISGTLLKLH